MRAIASETKGATDYLASSVPDFVQKLVRWEVQTALGQQALDHGGGRECESESARQKWWRIHRDTARRATASQNGQSGQLLNN